MLFRVIKHTHAHTHAQRKMTRYVGRISSHDSDQTRVIEIYTRTRTPRDDTPQWLTASIITSFNFHTFFVSFAVHLSARLATFT